jgi:hypothetical protein
MTGLSILGKNPEQFLSVLGNELVGRLLSSSAMTLPRSILTITYDSRTYDLTGVDYLTKT